MSITIDIYEYLAQDERKDLLRFLTAGSVDDGKSTLIGRLLYDCKKIYEDQLDSLIKDSSRIGKAGDNIDYALLLDGLRAEREQGITIDVAYRFFSTNNRKFIIADTPGHEQYTRNMITGGSTADLAIILIDATKGVIQQTRRHTFLVSLLGIRKVVLAVNKMDLADYRQDVFDKIASDYKNYIRSFDFASVAYIPMSALNGDNVVNVSERMPWYDGQSLLDYLETVPVDKAMGTCGMRLPVQYVITSTNYRGYAGRLTTGQVCQGDKIIALPSGVQSTVKRVEIYGKSADCAYAPQCISVVLDDEIDVSRGDMIVHLDSTPHISDNFTANLVWFDEQPMDSEKNFVIKHNTCKTRAKVTAINYKIDVNTLEKSIVSHLVMNDIASVDISTGKKLMFDLYNDNKVCGSFILIDPVTNNTCAAGIITKNKQPLHQDCTNTSYIVLDLKKLGISADYIHLAERICKELAKHGIFIKFE